VELAPGHKLATGFAMPKTKLRATKKAGKVNIVLKVREYEELLDDLDELDSVRAYDAAKKSGEKPVSFERAMREIESPGM
jgi:hypothetical protein